MAATRHEHGYDAVARLQIIDEGPDLLDNPSRLVAERHRQRPRPIAVDDGKVGMAEAGGDDAHQDFAGTGAVELDLLNSSGDARPHRAAPAPSLRAQPPGSASALPLLLLGELDRDGGRLAAADAERGDAALAAARLQRRDAAWP